MPRNSSSERLLMDDQQAEMSPFCRIGAKQPQKMSEIEVFVTYRVSTVTFSLHVTFQGMLPKGPSKKSRDWDL
jgi:hypothetical protein